MTDKEIQDYLKQNGYPEHVWRAGKAGLLAQWDHFVSQVEAGYPLTLEDYRNDLDVRAILGELGLQSETADADRRLRKMLIFSEESIWDSDLNPDAFWLYGYPRNADGDLLADLKAEGFL